MEIRWAHKQDLSQILAHDQWVEKEVLTGKIERGEVAVCIEDGAFAGWLRWGLFWDNTPFVSMLHLLPEYRGRGIGTQMMAFWEKEMEDRGYPLLMTSTSSSETSQHFYQKLGYAAVGSFLPPGEPLELIFLKII